MMKTKKSVLAAALAVSAAAAMSLTASAEIALEKVYEVAESQFLYGSNMLMIEGNGGFSIATMDGTVKSEPVYSRSAQYEYGMIVVNRNNGEANSAGALNQNCQEMIPTKYGELDVLNAEWALGIVLKDATADQYDYKSLWGDEAYYMIDTVDVYHVADGVASALATLPRENFMEARAYGAYINIKDRATGIVSTYDASFQKVVEDAGDVYAAPEGAARLISYRENGRYGVKGADGNIVAEPAYSYIGDFQHGYAQVEVDDKKGLIDEQGNVAVEPVYDYVNRLYYLPYDTEYGQGGGYNANGYFAVELDDKLGYVDEQGNVTMEPKYSTSVVEINGASALLTDLEGKQRLLAADGIETVVEGYERMNAFDFGSGVYYRVQDADYQEGMIDWHGNEIIPCDNDDVMLSGDGKYVIVNHEYGDGVSVIYKMPDAEATAAEVPAETPAASENAGDAAEETAVMETEAPAEETQAPEAGAGNMDSAKALLESAATLLDNDSAEIRSSVKTLVEQAAAIIGSQNESAKILLDNALALLETEGADGAAIKAILSSVTALL